MRAQGPTYLYRWPRRYRRRAGSDPSLRELHRHHCAAQANLSHVNRETLDLAVLRDLTSHDIALESQLVFQDSVEELAILAAVRSVNLNNWVSVLA